MLFIIGPIVFIAVLVSLSFAVIFHAYIRASKTPNKRRLKIGDFRLQKNTKIVIQENKKDEESS